VVVALAPPPTRGRPKRTYDALLDATEACLDRGGWAAATSTAVAAEAGLSVGTFYAYFADRDHALAALFRARLARLLGEVGGALSIEAVLDDGLPAVMQRTIDAVLSHYARHSAAFRAALVALPSSRAIRDVYWEAHRASEEALVQFIRRSQRAGVVRAGDATVLAQTMLVIIQGGNNPLLLARPRAARTRAVRHELGRALTILLARDPGRAGR